MQYFLCEHTKLVEVKREDAVPRLLKWKISDLRKSLKDFEQLSQIPLDKVSNKLKTTLEHFFDVLMLTPVAMLQVLFLADFVYIVHFVHTVH